LPDLLWNLLKSSGMRAEGQSDLRGDALCIPRVPGDRDESVGVVQLVPYFRRHFQILARKKNLLIMFLLLSIQINPSRARIRLSISS